MENSLFEDTLQTLIAADVKGKCFALFPNNIEFIFPEGEKGPRINGPLYVSIPVKKISHLLRYESVLRFLMQE